MLADIGVASQPYVALRVVKEFLDPRGLNYHTMATGSMQD